MKDSPRVGGNPFRNGVLASLPPSDLERIRPKLQMVELEARQILCRPQAPIRAVYFPESGIVSLVARLERGGSIEIGIIGREGMVGLPLAFGAESSPDEALVQVTCSALRMEADDFQRELARSPALLPRLLRFGCALYAQVAQTAACNGRHAIEQRLTRWLLMAHDRLDTDDLPLTQELLATMLGVRRASVTAAIGLLRRVGAIDIVRGHVTILDRPALERLSCECYATVRQEYRRLQPDPAVAVRHDRAETADLLLRHPPALSR
ncbi:Crp/Fnr family transcriptional regulator [Roseicella aquatilis]|uniref:Crp/Fnr family transcriptional regulator n=1 Tax=Roseicella aquatilis TaxID=2527868 RepID=A0A4R4DQ77_9PROT|nr:Crp/Fnr family transcriptional regulator [Roseicella aquatilis]TCZ63233.1 Crp/Fnr family transcriptional regulator [Roseicella aquatilis]